MSNGGSIERVTVRMDRSIPQAEGIEFCDSMEVACEELHIHGRVSMLLTLTLSSDDLCTGKEHQRGEALQR